MDAPESRHGICVVMPAYNVAHVLRQTVEALPPGWADKVFLVDDASKDSTAETARELGLQVLSHPRNRGYGAAQKTGFREAINRGFELVVLVHGDNQYDPGLAAQFAAAISEKGFDVATGTRFRNGTALRCGMPLWKYIPNRVLTWLENIAFGTRLSDYHNGYRAYRTRLLASIPLESLSDDFSFDTDILLQAALRKALMTEIPHEARYRKENSQMSFGAGIRYGLRILRTLFMFGLHRTGLRPNPLYSGEDFPQDRQEAVQ